MIQQTSLEAYEGVQDGLGLRQFAVLNAILLLQPATDKEVSEYLGWPINCVTPRRGELYKLGKIKVCGTTEGRKRLLWKAV